MDHVNHPTLLIATRNPGKVNEIFNLLQSLPLTLRHLGEFSGTPEVEEIGKTFIDNAIHKAREISAHTGLVTLADDSGLEVDALGGAPGVRSARYGGPHLNDAGRTRLLLTEMERFGSVTRQARFVCVLALAAPQTVHPRIFQGVCEGHIALSPRGRRGFGYDPVFIPDGHVLTFGQLPDEVKSRLSHRAQALAALRKFLSPVCPLDLILSTPAV